MLSFWQTVYSFSLMTQIRVNDISKNLNFSWSCHLSETYGNFLFFLFFRHYRLSPLLGIFTTWIAISFLEQCPDPFWRFLLRDPLPFIFRIEFESCKPCFAVLTCFRRATFHHFRETSCPNWQSDVQNLNPWNEHWTQRHLNNNPNTTL